MTQEEIAEAIRLLENAGFHNISVDRTYTHMYVEDPSCVLRSFETFLDYAWIAIAFVTTCLLLGWAVAMLRGIKQKNLINNVRNLALMFLFLSLIRPAMNLVYGNDIFAQGCKNIEIKIEYLKQLLDARHKKFEDLGELSKFEIINIFDSGQIKPKKEKAEPYVPESVPHSYASNNDTKPKKLVVDIVPIAAYPDGEDVVYIMSDGSRFKLISGTRAWRNSNPGAIKDSDLARQLGAIGAADLFAVFPDEKTGMQALETMLQMEPYKSQTLRDALTMHLALPEEATEEINAYHMKIQEITQLQLDRPMDTMTAIEINTLARAIAGITEWKQGLKQTM